MTKNVVQMNKRQSYTDEKLAGMLASALHDLPDNYLMCRDMRHAWELQHDFFAEGNRAGVKGEIKRILVCLRCGMERVERYSQTRWGLDKVGQTYHYPEAYQIHGLPRGVKPSSIVQGEQYRRAMEKVAKASRRKKA